MKLLLISVLSIAFLFITNEALAQDNVKEVLESKKETKKESTSRRRKKVMMCHECGKPEVECECEGEGHGVHEDEANEKDER